MDDIRASIPKIIHYCWFGRNPLPELALRCIASWKKFLPDYEIKEWNEDNYDVKKIPYIAEAYNAKKYAFVSDYARFDILYEFGGIYFDTDVEVIKDITPIIENGAFAGVECAGALAAGLGIASPARMDVFTEIMDSYKEDHFVNLDGSLNLKTVVARVSDIFRNHGFSDELKIQKIAGVTIYPYEYFCPINPFNGKMTITDNTYTIHHYAQSWMSPVRRLLRSIILKIGGEKVKKVILKTIFKLNLSQPTIHQQRFINGESRQ